jgi:hypothetical protein
VNTLSNCLENLFAFLSKRGLVPPLQDVRIVEIPPGTLVNDEGRVRISPDALYTVADFEPRFERLSNLGLPWINVTCYGVYQRFLIIGIETPNVPRNAVPAARTSINYSGPSARVLKHEWNALEEVAIERS